MIVFHPAKPDDATVLFDWLRERLKVGFLRVGHGNRIIVEDCPLCRDKNVKTPHYEHS